jgi:hypothetical protein
MLDIHIQEKLNLLLTNQLSIKPSNQFLNFDECSKRGFLIFSFLNFSFCFGTFTPC